jgi:hypothetical protein
MYARAIPGLLNHEGIDFVMVKSQNTGSVILSAKVDIVLPMIR